MDRRPPETSFRDPFERMYQHPLPVSQQQQLQVERSLSLSPRICSSRFSGRSHAERNGTSIPPSFGQRIRRLLLLISITALCFVLRRLNVALRLLPITQLRVPSLSLSRLLCSHEASCISRNYRSRSLCRSRLSPAQSQHEKRDHKRLPAMSSSSCASLVSCRAAVESSRGATRRADAWRRLRESERRDMRVRESEERGRRREEGG